MRFSVEIKLNIKFSKKNSYINEAEIDFDSIINGINSLLKDKLHLFNKAPDELFEKNYIMSLGGNSKILSVSINEVLSFRGRETKVSVELFYDKEFYVEEITEFKIKSTLKSKNFMKTLKNIIEAEEYNFFEYCQNCDGEGTIEKFFVCEECDGEGCDYEGDFCDACNGDGGEWKSKTCRICDGAGGVSITSPIEIDIKNIDFLTKDSRIKLLEE